MPKQSVLAGTKFLEPWFHFSVDSQPYDMYLYKFNGWFWISEFLAVAPIVFFNRNHVGEVHGCHNDVCLSKFELSMSISGLGKCFVMYRYKCVLFKS